MIPDKIEAESEEDCDFRIPVDRGIVHRAEFSYASCYSCDCTVDRVEQSIKEYKHSAYCQSSDRNFSRCNYAQQEAERCQPIGNGRQL